MSTAWSTGAIATWLDHTGRFCTNHRNCQHGPLSVVQPGSVVKAISPFHPEVARGGRIKQTLPRVLTLSLCRLNSLAQYIAMHRAESLTAAEVTATAGQFLCAQT